MDYARQKGKAFFVLAVSAVFSWKEHAMTRSHHEPSVLAPGHVDRAVQARARVLEVPSRGKGSGCLIKRMLTLMTRPTRTTRADTR